jgi:hypothetical protein
MNPTMLEASDDLTNLSHLNEPAGMFNTDTDQVVQSFKQFDYGTRKKKYTPTVESF